jgi:hypothetical protein
MFELSSSAAGAAIPARPTHVVEGPETLGREGPTSGAGFEFP